MYWAKHVVVIAVLIAAVATSASARQADYSFALSEVSSGMEFTAESSSQGKPVVVHIWSANCPHCRLHMPYAAALYSKLDPEVASFVSICVDSTANEAQKYITERDLKFPVLMESSGQISDDYLELGWPTTFVLNADGSLAGLCETQGPQYVTEVLELAEAASHKASHK